MHRIISVLRTPPAGKPAVQVLRYSAVVGTGYLLAIASYTGEIAIGINAYLAFGATFVLNCIFNFTLLRIWAFPPSGRKMVSDLKRFCVVAIASFLVNYASFALLYSLAGLAATNSQRLAIVIAAPVTFLANRLWSFQTNHERAPCHEDDGIVPTSAKKTSYSRMQSLASYGSEASTSNMAPGS